MTINISLKALAKYIVSDPAGQRRILQDLKFRTSEGRAQRLYYADAVHAIRARHAGRYSRAAFVAKAAQLRGDAISEPNPKVRTRTLNNARVIEQYDEMIGDDVAIALPKRKLFIRRGAVVVSAMPDLCLRVRGKEWLVKLAMATEEPDERILKVLAQGLFEAASVNGVKLPAASVRIVDVPRHATHKGARMGSRIRAQIDAALEMIENLWPSVVPPLRRARA